MPNPEQQNLFFLEGGTEMHMMNPRDFSVQALREIVRLQVYRDDAPIEIVMVYQKRTKTLPASAIREARKYFGKDRRRFLDVVAPTMHDAEEIIILKQQGVGTRVINKPPDSRYNTVFREFIENNPNLT